jgi:hypothetical protein
LSMSSFDKFGEGDWIAEESIGMNQLRDLERKSHFDRLVHYGGYTMRRVKKDFQLDPADRAT